MFYIQSTGQIWSFGLVIRFLFIRLSGFGLMYLSHFYYASAKKVYVCGYKKWIPLM